MNITDIDSRIIKGHFHIEVDQLDYTVEAKDFFDWVCETGRAYAHDPYTETVVYMDYDGSYGGWKPERKRVTTLSYDRWLIDNLADDEIFLNYIKITYHYGSSKI